MRDATFLESGISMVDVFILPHAEFGHREYALPLTRYQHRIKIILESIKQSQSI